MLTDLMPRSSDDQARKVALADPVTPADVSEIDLSELAVSELALGVSQLALSERTDELARAVVQLATANEELAAFSYSVSHDLRAPLRAVVGFSRLAVDEFGDDLPSEARRYLAVVNEAAVHMEQMIDGLLAFAQLGRQGINPRVTPLRSIVNTVLEGHVDEIAARAVQVHVSELPSVKADPLLIGQVFENLISNALKYTRNERRPQIEIGTLRGEGALEVFVADNGVGFDMEYAANLFGVFHRLHRAEDYEGTGIGLALVRRIVERHGGTVRAEAQQGAGATFFVQLEEAA
jgi:light-regulated signal transduction histidine kinase (bacteriophytochrome)